MVNDNEKKGTILVRKVVPSHVHKLPIAIIIKLSRRKAEEVGGEHCQIYYINSLVL